MEREKTIEGNITTLIASSNNNTFHDTLFKSTIDVPYKPDLKDAILIHDEALGGLPTVKGYSLTFNDCTFDKNVNMSNDNNKSCVLTFENCIFEKEVIAEDAVMDGKIRFKNCHFKGVVNFKNTTFNNLADFWGCVFHEKTIFYKTAFLETAVFSATTFKENILFTYTLVNKLIIFRGTKVKKGIDLSLTIISGDLSVFDLNVNDYDAIDVSKYAKDELNKNKRSNSTKEEKQRAFDKIYENKYEKSVYENGEIPLTNKRETFRILKKYYESQSNFIESIPYKKLEKESLRKEFNNKTSLTNFLDKGVLFLNKYSNNFGTSIKYSFWFIVLFGGLLFYLSVLQTSLFSFSFSIDWDSFCKGLGYFMQFLNPTHKINYLGNVNATTLFYILDFFGRIIIGYGIYQFIQAFRKFR
jgi:hypothetical protein